MNEQMMPRYTAHAEVSALKIGQVIVHDPPPGMPVAGGFLFFDDSSFGHIEVDVDFLKKHNPQPGGYYVVLANGARTFMPAAAFEEAYTKI